MPLTFTLTGGSQIRFQIWRSTGGCVLVTIHCLRIKLRFILLKNMLAAIRILRLSLNPRTIIHWKKVDNNSLKERKKKWCHKSGNAPGAKFKTVEIFVSRLKPDTRIGYIRKWFGTSSRMQEVCGFKHWEPDMIHMHLSKFQQNFLMKVT